MILIFKNSLYFVVVFYLQKNKVQNKKLLLIEIKEYVITEVNIAMLVMYIKQ